MDYGRMDSVNGNYTAENSHMAENNPAWAEQERRRAEERKKEEERRLEADRKAAVMRGAFPFFGWASAVYALFIRSVCTKMLLGLPTLFFVAGTLAYFGLCTRKSGVPLKKTVSLPL